MPFLKQFPTSLQDALWHLTTFHAFSPLAFHPHFLSILSRPLQPSFAIGILKPPCPPSLLPPSLISYYLLEVQVAISSYPYFLPNPAASQGLSQER